jgi:antitoxin (DNA-binding transcriptional repressor) of toxin-antitoxin stability system
MVLLSRLVVQMSALRTSLSRYRRRVLRGEAITVEYYGDPVAVLRPYQEGLAGVEMPLTEFRGRISECWENLDSGLVNAYVLTHHGQPQILFLPYKGEK